MPKSALRRDGVSRRLSRYTAGSVVAAVSSEVTLLACYGLFDLTPRASSTIAWLAGALPNYWLNRRWTWGRRGRPSLMGEVLPYLAIIGVTLLLAVEVTRSVDEWMRDVDVSVATRTAVVAVAFAGVYVVMFLVLYVLLDRLFRPRAGVHAGSDEGSVARSTESNVGVRENEVP